MTPQIEILYETDGILVCVKPPGVLSQSGSGANMPALLEEMSGCEIFPVHRLDRETSGVMVFAKSSAAAAELSAQIARGELAKKYYAVTAAGMSAKSGQMRDLLFRDRQKNKTFVVKRMRRGVREAVLDYSLATEREGYALWDIGLQTGRTHQIRVQFASRGFPLYGDARYGGERGGELALFAYRLTFTEPFTSKELSFTAEPPARKPFDIFGGAFR